MRLTIARSEASILEKILWQLLEELASCEVLIGGFERPDCQDGGRISSHDRGVRFEQTSVQAAGNCVDSVQVTWPAMYGVLYCTSFWKHLAACSLHTVVGTAQIFYRSCGWPEIMYLLVAYRTRTGSARRPTS
jgi:hypothetical protein